MAEMCSGAGGLRGKMNKRSKLLFTLENFFWQNSPYILNGPRECIVSVICCFGYVAIILFVNLELSRI